VASGSRHILVRGDGRIVAGLDPFVAESGGYQSLKNYVRSWKRGCVLKVFDVVCGFFVHKAKKAGREVPLLPLVEECSYNEVRGIGLSFCLDDPNIGKEIFDCINQFSDITRVV